MATNQIIQPYLGKPADDGNVYVWHYTEWFLLRHAHFVLTQDGKVCIDITKEKENQSGYLKHYASGQPNAEIYEKEMRALAPHINLQFPEKVDWHGNITFTPACSDHLFNMKLHFDIDAVKSLLKARNNHRFFQQAWKSGHLKENLPEDLVKLIYTLALGPMVAPENLAAPLNQSYAIRY